VKPAQASQDLVVPDIAPFVCPVLSIFHKIADREPDIGFDRGEHADDAAAPADLHVQPLLAVGRGDPLLVDLGEVVERERVLEPLFQATDRLGEPLLVVLDQSGGRPASALLIGLEPDLLQMGREAALFPMRHLGQDVPHEVDLAALPRGAEPLLPDRDLEAGVGVGDAERRSLHPPALKLPEKGTPAVLRFVEHGLYSQDLSAPGLAYPAGCL
jgi:hypothetical protein